MNLDIFKTPPPRIVGELRQRVNQISHSYGVKEGLRYRNELTLKLQQASINGASLSELHLMLDTIEVQHD